MKGIQTVVPLRYLSQTQPWQRRHPRQPPFELRDGRRRAAQSTQPQTVRRIAVQRREPQRWRNAEGQLLKQLQITPVMLAVARLPFGAGAVQRSLRPLLLLLMGEQRQGRQLFTQHR